MMTKNADKKREQMMMFSMDDMVPQNHMLRLIDKAINWNFIYDLVEEKYCPDNGRPSMDPVMLIKIPFIQYLYGIKSMRQTMKEIEVNVAYRWFLGLDMLDPVPHFSTFGKNYTRRFKNTDLFEQIFSKILEDCMKYKFLPILEETGLIIPVGRWMMKEVMEKCKLIRKLIPEFKVNINISQVQVAKSEVILDLVDEIEKAGLSTDAVNIELTESVLLENNINTQHFLKELKRMKINLALDDFGTGYSNFHYLSELNPEIIKIDRTFTANAVADEKEYYLLKQFCEMIHRLGLKICIEGVENEEEWAKIKKLKPEYCQGFYWGKPCEYDDFIRQFVDKAQNK